MGIDVIECLTFASTASAISVTRKGASNSIPLKEEVVNYLFKDRTLMSNIINVLLFSYNFYLL